MTHAQYLELVRELLHHDKLYGEARPAISDYEYDQMMSALLDYEAKHPEKIATDSPSQKLWETATDGFQSKSHLVPMYSLANTYSAEEIEDFSTGRKKARKT